VHWKAQREGRAHHKCNRFSLCWKELGAHQPSFTGFWKNRVTSRCVGDFLAFAERVYIPQGNPYRRTETRRATVIKYFGTRLPRLVGGAAFVTPRLDACQEPGARIQ
jgi:hypothetical protein